MKHSLIFTSKYFWNFQWFSPQSTNYWRVHVFQLSFLCWLFKNFMHHIEKRLYVQIKETNSLMRLFMISFLLPSFSTPLRPSFANPLFPFPTISKYSYIKFGFFHLRHYLFIIAHCIKWEFSSSTSPSTTTRPAPYAYSVSLSPPSRYFYHNFHWISILSLLLLVLALRVPNGNR